jgi:hypothetical protein
VIGIALKFLGDLIERPCVLDTVWHLGLKDVIVRVFKVGSSVARIGCLCLCSSLIRFGGREQTRFLTNEGLVRQCAGFVDEDAPDLALPAIDFLITLLERCLVAAYYDVLHVVDLEQFTDTLKRIGLAHGQIKLGDRAAKY